MITALNVLNVERLLNLDWKSINSSRLDFQFTVFFSSRNTRVNDCDHESGRFAIKLVSIAEQQVA